MSDLAASDLAPGLLVAAPPLGDPNFDRSVVLLAAHSAEGAFGWVINGREVMTLSELVVRAQVTDRELDLHGSVRIGGPVSPEQVWLIYRTEERFEDIDGQIDVGHGICACASRKVLEAIANGARPESVIALVGFAGWGPSQLEGEILHGAWLPTDVEPGIVFDVPIADRWHHAYERVGTTPIAFTTRIVGSA
jgi:putative transcriptional regulator